MARYAYFPISHDSNTHGNNTEIRNIRSSTLLALLSRCTIDKTIWTCQVVGNVFLRMSICIYKGICQARKFIDFNMVHTRYGIKFRCRYFEFYTTSDVITVVIRLS